MSPSPSNLGGKKGKKGERQKTEFEKRYLGGMSTADIDLISKTEEKERTIIYVKNRPCADTDNCENKERLGFFQKARQKLTRDAGPSGIHCICSHFDTELSFQEWLEDLGSEFSSSASPSMTGEQRCAQFLTRYVQKDKDLMQAQSGGDSDAAAIRDFLLGRAVEEVRLALLKSWRAEFKYDQPGVSASGSDGSQAVDQHDGEVEGTSFAKFKEELDEKILRQEKLLKLYDEFRKLPFVERSVLLGCISQEETSLRIKMGELKQMFRFGGSADKYHGGISEAQLEDLESTLKGCFRPQCPELSKEDAEAIALTIKQAKPLYKKLFKTH